MKQSELLRKQADMMDMAEKYGIDDWRKLVQFRWPNCKEWQQKIEPSFHNSHPNNEYRFALGVVEGKPVFEGDVLYHKELGKFTFGPAAEHEYFCVHEKELSWTPPKPKTVMVELRRETVEYYANLNTMNGDIVPACRKALEESCTQQA